MSRIGFLAGLSVGNRFKASRPELVTTATNSDESSTDSVTFVDTSSARDRQNVDDAAPLPLHIPSGSNTASEYHAIAVPNAPLQTSPLQRRGASVSHAAARSGIMESSPVVPVDNPRFQSVHQSRYPNRQPRAFEFDTLVTNSGPGESARRRSSRIHARASIVAESEIEETSDSIDSMVRPSKRKRQRVENTGIINSTMTDDSENPISATIGTPFALTKRARTHHVFETSPPAPQPSTTRGQLPDLNAYQQALQRAEDTTCVICQDNVVPVARGVLPCCFHMFHAECILQWAEITNRCPMCKLEFNTVARLSGDATSVTVLEEWLVPSKEQTVTLTGDEIAALGYTEEEMESECYVCHRSDREDVLLLCDAHCGHAAHTFCVGLTAVPEGDWFCDACAEGREPSSSSERLVSFEDENQEIIDTTDSLSHLQAASRARPITIMTRRAQARAAASSLNARTPAAADHLLSLVPRVSRRTRAEARQAMAWNANLQRVAATLAARRDSKPHEIPPAPVKFTDAEKPFGFHSTLDDVLQSVKSTAALLYADRSHSSEDVTLPGSRLRSQITLHNTSDSTTKGNVAASLASDTPATVIHSHAETESQQTHHASPPSLPSLSAVAITPFTEQVATPVRKDLWLPIIKNCLYAYKGLSREDFKAVAKAVMNSIRSSARNVEALSEDKKRSLVSDTVASQLQQLLAMPGR